MSSRTTASRTPAALRRKVLGLLAIVWLNMAVLPCAMAFQGDDDCPHCPPAGEHEEGHDMAAHHGHDDTKSEPSCATAQTDCCDAVAASVDARGGKIEYKNAADIVFVGVPPAEGCQRQRGAHSYGSSDPPDIAGASLPLNVLNCVYLK